MNLQKGTNVAALKVFPRVIHRPRKAKVVSDLRPRYCYFRPWNLSADGGAHGSRPQVGCEECGFDPISTPPPVTTFAFKRAATKVAKPEDFQREIIDFNSESPAGLQFMSFSTATGLSRFTDISWPRGLAPKTGPKPRGGRNSPLPRADVLVVTWTVDEGHALSWVFTPGQDAAQLMLKARKPRRPAAA